MTVTTALVATVLVLVGVNVWVHVGPDRWQPVTGPVLAALLLVVGRSAGLSWEQLGLGRGTVLAGLAWGGAAAALVGAGYAVGLSVPSSRRLFLDARQQVGAGRAARRALVVVPLGVVVFEEVAFRGVLWGLVAESLGAGWAAAITSVLFGLWHVLPALDGARADVDAGAAGNAGHAATAEGGTTEDGAAGDGNREGDRDDPGARPPGRGGTLVRQVVGTVAFTTLAGAVFAVLREQSGSLVAPFLLHWATNGLGVAAAAWAWSLSRED